MTRRSWVYIEGVAYEKGVDIIPDKESKAPGFIPDIVPFVSSVDGTLISSRSDLRSHNDRNNVISIADIQGLPPKTSFTQHQPSQYERLELKRQLWHVMDSNRR